MSALIKSLIGRFPKLESVAENINQAYLVLESSYLNDSTLFVCGNGGNAADSEHIVGELMKGFQLKRPIDSETKNQLIEAYQQEGELLADNLQKGLRAVSLNGHPALSTAFANDVNPDMIFAQQLFVLGREDDVLLALSTSGNSANVLKCLEVAKVKKLKTIVITGSDGGACAEIADCAIKLPAEETHLVQEFQLPVYHTLCLMLEEKFYG